MAGELQGRVPKTLSSAKTTRNTLVEMGTNPYGIHLKTTYDAQWIEHYLGSNQPSD